MARRKQGVRLTAAERDAAKARFLAAYEQAGTIRGAARAVGVDRQTVLRWRRADIRFSEAFDGVTEDTNDEVRMEVWRCAIVGWDEPVFWRGSQVGVTRRYSDKLLSLLAYARLPEMRHHVQIDAHLDAAQIDPSLVARITPELAILAAEAMMAIDARDAKTVDADCPPDDAA